MGPTLNPPPPHPIYIHRSKAYMSTATAAVPIDPALLAEESAKKHGSITGVKRKSRGAVPAVSSTPARTTRRSARNAQGVEPARGEEENLNTYDGAKRSKANSPKDTTQSRRRSLVVEQPGNPPDLTVKKDLPFPSLPYPYGLTPFRYQCHTPHLPPPPPGDPMNPNFHPFDPSAASGTPPPVPRKDGDSQATNRNVTPSTTNISNADVTQYLSNGDYPPLDSNEAAFQSLSALLAASQGYEGAQLDMNQH